METFLHRSTSTDAALLYPYVVLQLHELSVSVAEANQHIRHMKLSLLLAVCFNFPASSVQQELEPVDPTSTIDACGVAL